MERLRRRSSKPANGADRPDAEFVAFGFATDRIESLFDVVASGTRYRALADHADGMRTQRQHPRQHAEADGRH